MTGRRYLLPMALCGCGSGHDRRMLRRRMRSGDVGCRMSRVVALRRGCRDMGLGMVTSALRMRTPSSARRTRFTLAIAISAVVFVLMLGVLGDPQQIGADPAFASGLKPYPGPIAVTLDDVSGMPLVQQRRCAAVLIRAGAKAGGLDTDLHATWRGFVMSAVMGCCYRRGNGSDRDSDRCGCRRNGHTERGGKSAEAHGTQKTRQNSGFLSSARQASGITRRVSPREKAG